MDHLDARIPVGKIVAYLPTVIRRPIINKNQNKLLITLRQNGSNALCQLMLARIVDRNNDRCLSVCLSVCREIVIRLVFSVNMLISRLSLDIPCQRPSIWCTQHRQQLARGFLDIIPVSGELAAGAIVNDVFELILPS